MKEEGDNFSKIPSNIFPSPSPLTTISSTPLQNSTQHNNNNNNIPPTTPSKNTPSKKPKIESVFYSPGRGQVKKELVRSQHEFQGINRRFTSHVKDTIGVNSKFFTSSNTPLSTTPSSSSSSMSAPVNTPNETKQFHSLVFLRFSDSTNDMNNGNSFGSLYLLLNRFACTVIDEKKNGTLLSQDVPIQYKLLVNKHNFDVRFLRAIRSFDKHKRSLWAVQLDALVQNLLLLSSSLSSDMTNVHIVVDRLKNPEKYDMAYTIVSMEDFGGMMSFMGNTTMEQEGDNMSGGAGGDFDHYRRVSNVGHDLEEFEMEWEEKYNMNGEDYGGEFDNGEYHHHDGDEQLMDHDGDGETYEEQPGCFMFTKEEVMTMFIKLQEEGCFMNPAIRSVTDSLSILEREIEEMQASIMEQEQKQQLAEQQQQPMKQEEGAQVEGQQTAS